MFVVTNDPKFTHVVDAMAPTDGGFQKQSFKVTFRLVEGEEFEKFDLNTREGSTEFLRRIIAGMDELVDANDQAIPYSDAIRDQVIRLPWARRAIVRTYFSAVNKEAEGN